ncbi:hypothetical protein ABZZ80_22255, partial [Streptomyces sp. NPDC006356]
MRQRLARSEVRTRLTVQRQGRVAEPVSGQDLLEVLDLHGQLVVLLVGQATQQGRGGSRLLRGRFQDL